MALTSTQYATITRKYDLIRSINEQKLKERKKEIESLSPEYDAIYKEIGDFSGKAAMAALNSDTNNLSAYKERIKELGEKQTEILKKLGKPADYLAPIYTCPLCRDTGVADGQRCVCFKKKAIELIYNDSNLRNITRGISLESFKLSLYPDENPDKIGKTPFAYASEALAVAGEFVKNFDSRHDNIFIYGNTGVGKTLLSACIAGELIQTTHSVIYLTAVDFFQRLEEYEENSSLVECDLLIIDDLGTELTNVYTNSKLFYCLNERLLRQKSTIISTNLNLDKLEDTYTERITSRILSSYIILKLTGEDLRTGRLFS